MIQPGIFITNRIVHVFTLILLFSVIFLSDSYTFVTAISSPTHRIELSGINVTLARSLDISGRQLSHTFEKKGDAYVRYLAKDKKIMLNHIILAKGAYIKSNISTTVIAGNWRITISFYAMLQAITRENASYISKLKLVLTLNGEEVYRNDIFLNRNSTRYRFNVITGKRGKLRLSFIFYTSGTECSYVNSRLTISQLSLVIYDNSTARHEAYLTTSENVEHMVSINSSDLYENGFIYLPSFYFDIRLDGVATGRNITFNARKSHILQFRSKNTISKVIPCYRGHADNYFKPREMIDVMLLGNISGGRIKLVLYDAYYNIIGEADSYKITAPETYGEFWVGALWYNETRCGFKIARIIVTDICIDVLHPTDYCIGNQMRINILLKWVHNSSPVTSAEVFLRPIGVKNITSSLGETTFMIYEDNVGRRNYSVTASIPYTHISATKLFSITWHGVVFAGLSSDRYFDENTRSFWVNSGDNITVRVNVIWFNGTPAQGIFIVDTLNGIHSKTDENGAAILKYGGLNDTAIRCQLTACLDGRNVCLIKDNLGFSIVFTRIVIQVKSKEIANTGERVKVSIRAYWSHNGEEIGKIKTSIRSTDGLYAASGFLPLTLKLNSDSICSEIYAISIHTYPNGITYVSGKTRFSITWTGLRLRLLNESLAWIEVGKTICICLNVSWAHNDTAVDRALFSLKGKSDLFQCINGILKVYLTENTTGIFSYKLYVINSPYNITKLYGDFIIRNITWTRIKFRVLNFTDTVPVGCEAQITLKAMWEHTHKDVKQLIIYINSSEIACNDTVVITLSEERIGKRNYTLSVLDPIHGFKSNNCFSFTITWIGLQLIPERNLMWINSGSTVYLRFYVRWNLTGYRIPEDYLVKCLSNGLQAPVINGTAVISFKAPTGVHNLTFVVTYHGNNVSNIVKVSIISTEITIKANAVSGFTDIDNEYIWANVNDTVVLSLKAYWGHNQREINEVPVEVCIPDLNITRTLLLPSFLEISSHRARCLQIYVRLLTAVNNVSKFLIDTPRVIFTYIRLSSDCRIYLINDKASTIRVCLRATFAHNDKPVSITVICNEIGKRCTLKNGTGVLALDLGGLIGSFKNLTLEIIPITSASHGIQAYVPCKINVLYSNIYMSITPERTLANVKEKILVNTGLNTTPDFSNRYNLLVTGPEVEIVLPLNGTKTGFNVSCNYPSDGIYQFYLLEKNSSRVIKLPYSLRLVFTGYSIKCREIYYIKGKIEMRIAVTWAHNGSYASNVDMVANVSEKAVEVEPGLYLLSINARDIRDASAIRISAEGPFSIRAINSLIIRVIGVYLNVVNVTGDNYLITVFLESNYPLNLLEIDNARVEKIADRIFKLEIKPSSNGTIELAVQRISCLGNKICLPLSRRVYRDKIIVNIVKHDIVKKYDRIIVYVKVHNPSRFLYLRNLSVRLENLEDGRTLNYTELKTLKPLEYRILQLSFHRLKVGREGIKLIISGENLCSVELRIPLNEDISMLDVAFVIFVALVASIAYFKFRKMNKLPS